MQTKFDKAYYDRFYRDPATRAVSPTTAQRQSEFIAAYLRYLDVPIKRFVDIGCGVGNVLRALQKAFPRARGYGVEYSDYLCEHYGWEKGSVSNYQPPHPTDLVLCNDVLGYLDDAACEQALRHLAEITTSALFLGVLTRQDLALCDERRTDSQQIARSLFWYQRRLRRNFVNVGGGLFLRKPLNVTVWNLDRLW